MAEQLLRTISRSRVSIAIVIKAPTSQEGILRLAMWSAYSIRDLIFGVTIFEWDGAILSAKSDIGLVTIQVLAVNEADFAAVRIALMQEGEFLYE